MSVFDPRDPKWKRCLEGCRPAAGMHREDCPNGQEIEALRVLAAMIGRSLGRLTP